MPEESPEKEGKIIETTSDSRIKTIVLLAPATVWLMNDLDNVRIPILMLTAEHDPFVPAWHAETVLKNIPDKSLVTFRQIAGAGHFSFISPFPKSMKNPKFPPSMDPEGFDREKFHTQLPKEMLDFLDEKLDINNINIRSR